MTTWVPDVEVAGTGPGPFLRALGALVAANLDRGVVVTRVEFRGEGYDRVARVTVSHGAAGEPAGASVVELPVAAGLDPAALPFGPWHPPQAWDPRARRVQDPVEIWAGLLDELGEKEVVLRDVGPMRPLELREVALVGDREARVRMTTDEGELTCVATVPLTMCTRIVGVAYALAEHGWEPDDHGTAVADLR